MWNWLTNLWNKVAPIAKAILDFVWLQLKAILAQVSADAIKQIQAKIVEADASTTMTNDQKFNSVLDYAKKLLPDMKEHALDLLIQSVFNYMKNKGTV